MTDPTILIGLILYLIAILGVGVFTSRYMKSLDDFVLGGRSLGPWVAAISERASGESAWFLLGLPGAAYAAGFCEFWSVIGIAFGIFASWIFIALPLRVTSARMGALTLPDYFEIRFGDGSRLLRIVSMVIIIFFYTTYVAAQFVGAGKVLKSTFGIPPEYGMLIGAFVVVAYTILGGFLAVAWTDLIQGLLMMSIAMVLPLVGFSYLGGFSGVMAALSSKGPEFFSMSGGQIGKAMWFGVVFGGLSWGVGYLGQPHLLTRYMAFKNEKDVRKGTFIALGWVLLAYWGAAFIGIIAAGILAPGLDKEMVMPLLTKKLLPGWLAGVFISGAIAAMMSTADSQLIVATSALVEDIYVRLIKKGSQSKPLVLYSRLATVAISIVAFYLAFVNDQFIYDMVAYAWSGLGSSFGPPLVLALLWKGASRWGTLAGMLGGLISSVVWQNSEVLSGILDLKIASFLISVFLAVFVSLATAPPAPELIEQGTFQLKTGKPGLRR